MISQVIYLVIYGFAYITMWKLLLDVGNLGFLKPYAITWTASAFICLLAGWKKFFPFASFFFGSVLGPLGVIILLFQKKDIRLLTDKEKNEDFYKRQFVIMEEKIRWLMKRDEFKIDSNYVTSAIQLYAEYCGLKLEMPIKYNIEKTVRKSKIFLREWRRILVAFNEEYRRRFAKKMPEIDDLIKEMDKIIQPGMAS
jgi:hypothetical protein